MARPVCIPAPLVPRHSPRTFGEIARSMSNRTYICISCRAARRAEAAYGLKTDLRCSQCGGRLWELEWRWRIPRKQDDKGWRELETKVARDCATWLPRRQQMGEEKIAEIDRQIQTVLMQKASPIRERRLRLLQSKRRATARKFTEPDGPANGSQPIRSETNRTSSAAGSRR